MILERNPNLPDYFLVLDRKASFEEYAEVYGDRLTEHYENNGVIIIPHMPIAFDIDLFNMITFPPAYKKIGTMEGLERPVCERNGSQFAINQKHPLALISSQPHVAMYVQHQIELFNMQLRQGLRLLFPYYRRFVQVPNITWRLTETKNEAMHLDSYNNAALMPSQFKKQRLKIFVNIDGAPRQWRMGFTLPELLKRYRNRLPDALPDEVNVVTDIINKSGILQEMPYHNVHYPTMSAVVTNGESVSHQVTYGNRTVAFEGVSDSMLDSKKLTHHCLGDWLRHSGYTIAPDAQAVIKQYDKEKIHA